MIILFRTALIAWHVTNMSAPVTNPLGEHLKQEVVIESNKSQFDLIENRTELDEGKLSTHY